MSSYKKLEPIESYWYGSCSATSGPFQTSDIAFSSLCRSLKYLEPILGSDGILLLCRLSLTFGASAPLANTSSVVIRRRSTVKDKAGAHKLIVLFVSDGSACCSSMGVGDVGQSR